MITKEDLKVGQYVKCIYGKYVEFIESVNSQYAYTNLKHRIYPKDYNDYIALSNEEVKALNVYSLNDELQDLLSNLKDLEDELGCPLEVREKTLDSFYCPKFENDKKLYSYYVYGFDNCDLFVYLSYSKYDDFYDEETKIPLKEYKKTWWLKGDLSE